MTCLFILGLLAACSPDDKDDQGDNDDTGTGGQPDDSGDPGTDDALDELLRGTTGHTIDLSTRMTRASCTDGEWTVSAELSSWEDLQADRVVALLWDVAQDRFSGGWDLADTGEEGLWDLALSEAAAGITCAETGGNAFLTIPLVDTRYGAGDGCALGVIVGMGHSGAMGGDQAELFAYTDVEVDSLSWRSRDLVDRSRDEQGEMTLDGAKTWSTQVGWEGESSDDDPAHFLGAWAVLGGTTVGAGAL